MKFVTAGLMAALAAAPLAAQAPALETHSSELGFSYALPADWQTLDAAPSLPTIKQQAQQNATTDEEKKGAACVQIALTARHGQPSSVVVVVTLPFDCFGQSMAEKDLPGFAMGASEGLKQSFDLSDPTYGSYFLGTHTMWIERAKGTPKGHPEAAYTVEVTCGLLRKAAVCWMAMLADGETLKTFESGAATLDGEPAAALVPATAFDKKPAQ